MEHDTTLLVKIHPNILGVNASSIYFLLWQKCFWSPAQQSHHDKDYNIHLDTCQKLKWRKKERIYDEHINSFSSTEKIGNINSLLGFKPHSCSVQSLFLVNFFAIFQSPTHQPSCAKCSVGWILSSIVVNVLANIFQVPQRSYMDLQTFIENKIELKVYGALSL